MIWYPGILKDLRKECSVDRGVSLEDAIFNHKLNEKKGEQNENFKINR